MIINQLEKGSLGGSFLFAHNLQTNFCREGVKELIAAKLIIFYCVSNLFFFPESQINSFEAIVFFEIAFFNYGISRAFKQKIWYKLRISKK
ncbi:hypothetical protein A8C56_02900 [Niabella ginsenosidivorans]|uniref:Uncharacterized protein n=1 Tax=Niabella ginsenosidivorans TaxID=1176587 RepID=A0A1A9HZ43_9BACT|nr:hypothetical protein A8C56_02900 [Niabella ginsenosidivorans]